MKKTFATLLFFAAFVADAQTVSLENSGDSFIFENKLCSEVNTDEITVGGRPFDPARDRLAMYGNGSIVIAP